MNRLSRVWCTIAAIVTVFLIAGIPASAEGPLPGLPVGQLDAFEFRNQNASLTPNDDDVTPTEPLAGTRGWRFAITNHYPAEVTITNPTISVFSGLPVGLFPNVTGFPVVGSAPTLGPEQTLTVYEMEHTNIAVQFTSGFAAIRTVAPLAVPQGGGNQTVTVAVTPQDVRYATPRAHIAVTVFGNALSIISPVPDIGETLDFATSGPNGASWMLHGAQPSKTYIFVAVIHVDTQNGLLSHKPSVTVEMTPHDSNYEPSVGKSIMIADPDLMGTAVFSVAEDGRQWRPVVDDYYVVGFSPYQQAPPPPPPPQPKPLKIKVDIKPGSDPNSINLGRNGVVSVAILSIGPGEDSEFPVLDATILDPSQLRIIDAADFALLPKPPPLTGASALRSNAEDIDGDGDLDLVLKFTVDSLEVDGLFDAATTEAVIFGPALPDPPKGVRGSDAVRITPGQ